MVVANHAVQRAPPPGQKTKSKQPKNYRNTEVMGTKATHPFESWESYGGSSGKTEYYEFSVEAGAKQRFDYERWAATAEQMTRSIHRSDRK